jgi:hypothetical protein
MRDLGWQAPGGVEVTFAALGGTGGGLVANVNRWRDQMGLEHVEDAAVADLPRADLMGQSAILVDLDGTYGGMGGPTKIEGAKLLGLIAELPRAALFLKMTGPAEAVEAQRDAFLFLGHSIRMGPPTPAEGLPPGHGMRPPAAGETQGSSAVSWSVPKDWKPTGGRTAFREATFVPEGHPDTEAWVSVLAGDGGGLLENINRWRRQMGQSALGDAEVRSLPQLEANGREGTLVTIHGSYDAGSMSSHQGKIEDATMLGFVLMRGGDSVFVKMVGPTDQVTAERGAFEAFVRSLRAP